MQIVAPRGCYLAPLDLIVDDGETIDVPEDLHVSLTAQGWKSPKKPVTQSEPVKPKED